MIRHFVILGGETLLNPHLPKIIDYACKQTKIFIVQVISNGTMRLKDELLQSLKANNKKCYVSLSDYSINEDLKRILKYDEIKETLKENEIKFQMAENKEWVSERGFAKEKSSDEMTRHKIKECFRSQCNCVMNGKLDICSKAAGARELGLLELRDYVDLVKSKNLKEDLVKFYQNDIYDACAYCILSDEKIQPAIQEGSKNG